jgi:hypothetical protein
VVVSGETFSYTFSRENGLIGAVKVLGQEITDGTPIPDLVLAEHLGPDFSPYAARREKQARVTIHLADPSHVLVASEGLKLTGPNLLAPKSQRKHFIIKQFGRLISG